MTSNRRTTRHRYGAGALFAVCAATSLVGCGSTSTSSAPRTTSKPTTASGAGTQVASGAPLKIMDIGTGASAGVSSGNYFSGAQAAVVTVNATGGVGADHRRLDLITCNNQANPNQDALCAKEAVSDHVVATVGELDLFSPITNPVLAAAGIPRIGQVPVYSTDLTNKDSYPIDGGGVLPFLGMGYAAKRAGDTKAAALVVQLAASEAFVPDIKEGVDKVGSTYRGTISVPTSGVSDFTPLAQQLKSLHASASVLDVTTANVPLIKAYASLGGTTTWIQPGNFTPAVISACGAVCNGVLGVDALPPSSATSIPAVKKFDSAMASTGNSASESSVTEDGWLSVYALEDLLSGVSGTITSTSVTSLLASHAPMDVEGLVTWNPSAHGPTGYTQLSNGDVWLTKVTGGKEMLTDQKPVDLYSALGLR